MCGAKEIILIMQVTRFMSRKEWDAFQDGKILVNDTDHYRGGKGGSLSVGFCFTEDAPEDAWVYLSGIVDAAVCVVFDFPDGYLRKSYGVYADHSEGAKFEDKVLKVEWCCVKYHRSIAKVVQVIDPFRGDGYEATKKIIEELEKMIWQ